jgi:hypothetical protein
VRLDILKLQSQAWVDIQKIQAILEIPIKDRTQSEKDALASLLSQESSLQLQLAAKKDLLAAIILQLKAEGQNTEELEKQLAILNHQLTAKAALKTYDAVGMQNLGSYSTLSLQATMQQMQSQLNNARSAYPTMSQSDFDMNNYYQESQIGSIQQELQFRQGFTSAYNSGGSQGALSYYTQQGGNALSFDTAMANMSNWSKGQDTTNQYLKTITNVLTS